jgi:hypothetical protein
MSSLRGFRLFEFDYHPILAYLIPETRKFRRTLHIASIYKFFRVDLILLTCIHLTNFFEEEKFSLLPSKNKVPDKIFRGAQIFSSNHKFQFKNFF